MFFNLLCSYFDVGHVSCWFKVLKERTESLVHITTIATVSQHLLRHLCIAAHSHPCAALRQHVRIACLLHRPRRCIAVFFWLKSASTVLRACWQLFVCLCRSDLVVADWSCWKLPHRCINRIRTSASTRAF